MSEDHIISYSPTEGLTYDPSEEKYWDPLMLDMEVRRTFEICHGCRMCFKYCDSFPILFKALDDQYDGDVRALNDGDIAEVMDNCFQCKLCDVQCPYTPRDNHEYQLDFPKLVHRYNAQRRKDHAPMMREKMLANPDGVAKMARMSFGMANAMNKVAAHRWFMEKALGIHKEKLLPDFASEPFDKWAEKNGKTKDDGEAVLFATCYVQNNEPDIGRDVVEVMEKNQVKLACGSGQVCCGMPAWEAGDLDTVRKNAKQNLDALLPYVEKGAKVLVVNPTCSMMMRREYPELVAEEDKERAQKLSEAINDCGEFLWSIRKEERFNTDFKSTPGGAVGYHAPCHLRAQAVGFKGRDLMKKIPGVKPKLVMECCGHDGTYAMKVETFEASARVGEKAFNGMKDAEAEVWATECPLAGIQFEQHAGKRALHPMTVLARAYREDGFPEKVPPKEDEK
ncbi:MAG: heterodisulfide reductase-related iron-sulfur binding cluster [Deltaproteobacteria bacterium]